MYLLPMRYEKSHHFDKTEIYTYHTDHTPKFSQQIAYKIHIICFTRYLSNITIFVVKKPPI